jgi:hypothetical protein
MGSWGRGGGGVGVGVGVGIEKRRDPNSKRRQNPAAKSRILGRTHSCELLYRRHVVAMCLTKTHSFPYWRKESLAPNTERVCHATGSQPHVKREEAITSSLMLNACVST